MPERQTFWSGQIDTGLKQRISSADHHRGDKSWNCIYEEDHSRQDLEQKNQGAEPGACRAPMSTVIRRALRVQLTLTAWSLLKGAELTNEMQWKITTFKLLAV